MGVGNAREQPADVTLPARLTGGADDQPGEGGPFGDHPVRLGQRLADEPPRP